MSFDKTKAMRSAERFLSQGKIRAAIGEYQRVVEFDPKDYSTLNILGDLYAKGNEIEDAVSCFKQVADHYSKQGFAQKAIAVYNKISRLDPNSVEVAEKLAQLHHSRGSFAEARTHYANLADQYQRKGKKAEALEIWKQIAKLDPNNTEVYLKVAEFCVQIGQKDEATKAYTEAGMRLAATNQVESALTAFSRALEIRQYDLAALNGYVKAQIRLGYADDAAGKLSKILEQSPYNREILYLLVDCYLESGNLEKAEESVVRLVEQEPANYPKFIDLVELYINHDDLISAARILSMSSEHLLVGGKHEEFLKWASEIVARDPEQLDALRLLVRYYGWQRDDRELRTALQRLAEVGRMHGSVDDEKYALTQLILIAPHEIEFAKRLQEIKIELGEFSVYEPPQPIEPPPREPAPQFSTFVAGDYEPSENRVSEPEFVFAGDPAGFEFAPPESVNGTSNGVGLKLEERLAQLGKAQGIDHQIDEVEIISDYSIAEATEPAPLSPSDELRLSQEIESVEFYIGQGYLELADRSIGALEAEFGRRPQFDELRTRLESPSSDTAADESPIEEAPSFSATDFQAVLAELQSPSPDSQPVHKLFDEPPIVAHVIEEPVGPLTGETETKAQQSPPPAEILPVYVSDPAPAKQADFLDEFRSELGLEESKPVEDDDFETVFQTAIAYKEMGLLEDSIRGFQDAVNRTRPNDGTRRFFGCCNLLGHCFMEKGMPNLGIMWYKRALEAEGLTAEERHAMQYELGSAYALAGDQAKAIGCFEQIYAVNVDYRDVSKRLEALYAPAR